MKLNLSVIFTVLVVLGLLCTVSLAKRKVSSERKHHAVRAALSVIEEPLIDQPDINVTFPVIVGVHPQFIPVDTSNATLSIDLLFEPSLADIYCCNYFGYNGSFVGSFVANLNGTSAWCIVPEYYQAGLFDASFSYCNSNVTSGDNFTITIYDQLPTITDVYPVSLVSFGTEEILINITGLPCANHTHGNSSLYVACKAGNTYLSWVNITENCTVIHCNTTSLPIGHVNISVEISVFDFPLSNSSLYSNDYQINVTSVKLEDVSPKIGCITGGTNVTFNITSFNGTINATIGADLPFCQFVPKYHNVLFNKEVTPLLINEFTQQFYCQTPSWNFTQTDAILTLVDKVHGTPISNPVSFQFTNSCISFVTPHSVPVSGGAQVALTLADVSAFRNATSHYYCYFTDAYGYSSAMPAKPVSENQLGCFSPSVSGTGLGSVALALIGNSTARTTSPAPIFFTD